MFSPDTSIRYLKRRESNLDVTRKLQSEDGTVCVVMQRIHARLSDWRESNTVVSKRMWDTNLGYCLRQGFGGDVHVQVRNARRPTGDSC